MSRVTLSAIIAIIMFGAILTTSGFSPPTSERVLAYESNQAGSLANVCGNGEEPFNVLCQNLFSEIQGDNNAANIIGLQTGGERTTTPPPTEPATDVDGDGIPDNTDNCHTTTNPSQADTDRDGVGNACDNAPNDPNPDQLDADLDGIGDVADNCVNVSNPSQTDTDGDGGGDACDEPDNRAPVAESQTITVNEDSSNSAISLRATDVDGDTLTYIVVTGPTHGTLAGTASNLQYTPAANYHGPDSFTFKANDGTVDSNVATVSITVNSVNDNPDAVDDTISTREDTQVTIGEKDNDRDVDGDTLFIESIPTFPVHGVLLIDPNGNLIYRPNPNFNGEDSFSYTISDGNGGTDTATVHITVSAVNDAPEANPDTATVAEDSIVTIHVLANDVDFDGDTLSVQSVTNPSHGTATINSDNTITYTPNLNFNGEDSFTYTISDGNGGTDTATVHITVTAVNDRPVARDDTATVRAGQSVIIRVLENDVDVDGDTLSVLTVIPPSDGTARVNPDNTITYTPGPTFEGVDFFAYRIDDGHGALAVASVTIREVFV